MTIFIAAGGAPPSPSPSRDGFPTTPRARAQHLAVPGGRFKARFVTGQIRPQDVHGPELLFHAHAFQRQNRFHDAEGCAETGGRASLNCARSQPPTCGGGGVRGWRAAAAWDRFPTGPPSGSEPLALEGEVGAPSRRRTLPARQQSEDGLETRPTRAAGCRRHPPPGWRRYAASAWDRFSTGPPSVPEFSACEDEGWAHAKQRSWAEADMEDGLQTRPTRLWAAHSPGRRPAPPGWAVAGDEWPENQGPAGEVTLARGPNPLQHTPKPTDA
jgi:hypothetical protein